VHDKIENLLKAFLDFYQTPQRLRKAVLHISSYDKCLSEAQFKNVEICAASRIAEGKACKV
jgi:hypothetical protein